MDQAPTDTGILARYTLDAAAWDAFVRAVRAHPQGHRLDLREATEAARTIVVSRDAIQVGGKRFDLAHYHVHDVVDHGTWLELRELDPDYLPCPLPLPPGDTALAASLLDHFGAIAARHTLQSSLLAQQAELERNLPTLSNRLLWFVERHFIACLLVFFLVVLPLGSLLVARFVGE